MFYLLLFSVVVGGVFEWQEIEGYGAKAITSQIKESSIVKNYGKGVLKKGLIYFDGGIFTSGNKLVIPEDAKILSAPAGLKISKTNIDIVKHDRYAVKYKESALKDEWQRLKKESAKELGVSSLEGLTVEQIMQINSGIKIESSNIRQSKRGGTVRKIYPRKTYISFFLIEINRQRKLLPVVLIISPIGEMMKKIEVSRGGYK
jgi:hypothetical protein